MKWRAPSHRAGTSVLAAATALATAAVLAGCGSDDGAGDDAARPGDAEASAEQESASPPPEPEPTPTPTPTEPTPEETPEFTPLAPEDAADGTDLGACADAECEVAVTAGATVPLGPDLGDVHVTEVGGGQVTITMAYPSGGGGSMRVGIAPRAGSFGNTNTMIVEFGVLGIEDGTAVLSFAPRQP